jgi:ATP synthase protein I
MDERETPGPLNDLSARIDRAARGQTLPSKQAGGNSGGDKSALGMGLRIGLELVVGVLVGVGVGWLLDRYMGTRPWGMIACFFLGVAAGMVNVYRAVTGMGMAVGYSRDGARPAPQLDDEDED